MVTLTLGQRDLGKGFSSHFEILPALDERTRSQVFGIRHEVYCEDLGFEPVRPDRQEVDEYDRHSIHCLMRTVDGTQTLVGCMRLILARPEDPDFPLPFEVACRDTLDQHAVDSRKLPRRTIAEVSRLAVRRQFRRRRGEERQPAAIDERDFGTPASPRFPFIPVGLYLGVTAAADRHGINKAFVLSEARLAAHITRLGFDVTQIGPPIEHHGTRVPSIIDVQKSIRGLRSLVRPMWHIVRAQIDAGYAISTKGSPPLPG